MPLANTYLDSECSDWSQTAAYKATGACIPYGGGSYQYDTDSKVLSIWSSAGCTSGGEGPLPATTDFNSDACTQQGDVYVKHVLLASSPSATTSETPTSATTDSTSSGETQLTLFHSNRQQLALVHTDQQWRTIIHHLSESASGGSSTTSSGAGEGSATATTSSTLTETPAEAAPSPEAASGQAAAPEALQNATALTPQEGLTKSTPVDTSTANAFTSALGGSSANAANIQAVSLSLRRRLLKRDTAVADWYLMIAAILVAPSGQSLTLDSGDASYPGSPYAVLKSTNGLTLITGYGFTGDPSSVPLNSIVYSQTYGSNQLLLGFSNGTSLFAWETLYFTGSVSDVSIAMAAFTNPNATPTDTGKHLSKGEKAAIGICVIILIILIIALAVWLVKRRQRQKANRTSGLVTPV
ncbi:hypothetical protein HDV00_005877 [Rhizophlyctis rosea]|nr:hypothetical protein HDV00_005877 [Rhizophlyctis rosea]